MHNVPGVHTGRDQFRTFFAQLRERLLSALVDKRHAGEDHALAFPARGFCLRPAGLQLRNPWLNQPAFQRPLLFGQRRLKAMVIRSIPMTRFFRPVVALLDLRLASRTRNASREPKPG